MTGERWDKSKVLIDYGKQGRGVRCWQTPPPRSLIFYGINFVVLEMKLNVLINLFALHEYLPEHRRMHTRCFWANYSSVVIEVDVFSRCKKVGEVVVVVGVGWAEVSSVCWLFYSSETFWVRTTNHKMESTQLNFCYSSLKVLLSHSPH